MITSLKQLQLLVQASKADRQLHTTSLQDRALFLATETGEILKDVLRIQGHYGINAKHAGAENIRKEMCDVIWNICDMATQLNIDLDEAMISVLSANKTRVWPDTEKDLYEEALNTAGICTFCGNAHLTQPCTPPPSGYAITKPKENNGWFLAEIVATNPNSNKPRWHAWWSTYAQAIIACKQHAEAQPNPHNP
jgi:NTP pyrophosphatase (non-canonical NTP hydrolase)